MRPPLIAGNWKMNGLVQEARDLAAGLRKELGSHAGPPEILVCPPFLALSAVRDALEGSPIRLGAQDVHWEPKGAFTGEVSTAMLKDVGCTAVVLGHSERRHIMGETNEMVNRKLKACLAAGLLPIVCVGELLEERNMGVTREVVERQMTKGLEGLSPEEVAKIVIAYEPVWAIGTGKTATPRQAVQTLRDLQFHDFPSHAHVALFQEFADAEHGEEARREAGLDLLVDHFVGFAHDVAPLAVAQENGDDADLLEHGRGDFAREGALGLPVDVLGADLDRAPLQDLADGFQREERGEDEDLGTSRVLAQPLAEFSGEIAGILQEPVHFPVSGDDRGAHGNPRLYGLPGMGQ